MPALPVWTDRTAPSLEDFAVLAEAAFAAAAVAVAALAMRAEAVSVR